MHLVHLVRLVRLARLARLAHSVHLVHLVLGTANEPSIHVTCMTYVDVATKGVNYLSFF
jgi:hypothetical protein